MTPLGRRVAWVAGTALVVGVGGRWEAVAGAGAALLLAVLACVAWTSTAGGVEVEWDVDQDTVRRGDRVGLRVAVRTRPRTLLPPPDRLEQQVGSTRLALRLARQSGAGVGPQRYEVPAVTRGALHLGPPEAVRADRFGVSRRAWRSGGGRDILVLPRTVHLAPLTGAAAARGEGATASPASGPVAFHSLREYHPGDDVRTIHWPSSAKAGTLIVRQHSEAAPPTLVVLLDCAADSYEAGKFEDAVDVAASVAASNGAASRDTTVRLCTTAGTGGALAGHDGLRAIERALAAVQADGTGDLVAALALLRPAQGWSGVVVVGGRIGGAMLPALAAAARRFDRVVAASVGPAQGATRPAPGVLVVSGPDADAVAAVWNRTVRQS